MGHYTMFPSENAILFLSSCKSRNTGTEKILSVPVLIPAIYKNLYRISSVSVSATAASTFVFCDIPVLEEVSCNLGEEGIRQNILILLFVLCHLRLQSLQLIVQKICRTAGNHFCIADTLLSALPDQRVLP